MLNDQLMTKINYADYTLEQLENWFHDALNEEDVSSSDIYRRMIAMLMNSREYHTNQLNKIEELLDFMTGPRITTSNSTDWKDFWEGDIGTL